MSFTNFRYSISTKHGPNCKCSLDFDGCAIRKFIEKLEKFEEEVNQ